MMKRIAAVLLLAAGTVLVCGSVAGGGAAAGAADHALMGGGPVSTASAIRIAGGDDTEDERIRRFNAAFSSDFDRSIALFGRACEGNMSPDERLATVEAGIDGLFALVGAYAQKAYELRTSNHILLLTIEDLLYDGMVFTRRGHSLADLVKNEDLSDNFASYYKYMYNLGDTVEAHDFHEAWARDMAAGLACLDR